MKGWLRPGLAGHQKTATGATRRSGRAEHGIARADVSPAGRLVALLCLCVVFAASARAGPLEATTADGIKVAVLGCDAHCLHFAGDGVLVTIGDDRVVIRNDMIALNGEEQAVREFSRIAIDATGWGLAISADDEPVASVAAMDGLRAAAKAGNPSALNDLALHFVTGIGAPRDTRRAAELYRRAAEAGLSVAARNLGFLLWDGEKSIQDRTQALRWFQEAAEAGDVTAQKMLAHAHEDGIGTSKNLVEARRWYEAAARAGDAAAMNNLGNLLKSGTPEDRRRAAALHRAAADKGLAVAAFNTGFDLWEGDGVEQDRAAALDWFERAARAGSTEAARMLDAIRDTGVAAQLDSARKKPRAATARGS
ncbi:tetratricopeptide repeat protein [Jiella mangrovi]|uniref:Sel1 repeat family protein n=1 Tax=Jiella mangrovi TaxID=2821407 RepID=A0ABS4BGE5_9HYPH|nr:tetratricopeptide repeat protein [Jiella mangrovi]MBP0615823.1 sel1 repeat family protein [Jiella mangrovi]